MLLVTALLFVRNLARAEDLDPGFDVEQVLVAQIGIVQGRFTPVTGTAWLDGAVERCAACLASRPPATARRADAAQRHDQRRQLVVNGQARDSRRCIRTASSVRTTSRPWHRDRQGARVPAGRPARRSVVVAVNEEFVRRYLSDVEPIGAQLRLPGPTEAGLAEVVAVVRNGKYRSLGESQQPSTKSSASASTSTALRIFVRSPGATLPSREHRARVLQELDPSAAIEVQPMRTRSPLRSCPAASVQACSAPWALSA